MPINYTGFKISDKIRYDGYSGKIVAVFHEWFLCQLDEFPGHDGLGRGGHIFPTKDPWYILPENLQYDINLDFDAIYEST